MIKTCLIVLSVLGISAVWGYSGGAPVDVCDDMIPRHPVNPQKSQFPYKVTIDQAEIKAGEKLKVTVDGGKSGKLFKGFLIEIRCGDDKAVGAFSIPDDDKYSKAINCHNTKQSAATHKNSTDKKTLSFIWTAPAKIHGSCTVYATVAETGAVFWVYQASNTFKLI